MTDWVRLCRNTLQLEKSVDAALVRAPAPLRTLGPGSKPASHGRYALIGQPETLAILERTESAPFLMRGQ